MGDERLERLGEPQFLERGWTQIGQNAAVLALKRFDLGLDRARRCASRGIVAKLFRQHRGARAQGEEMRSEFVVELVSDHLAFLVLGVENPLSQFAVGALQAAERLGETVDLGVEIADLRRSAAFGARRVVARLEARERSAARRQEVSPRARPGDLSLANAASAIIAPTSAWSRAPSQTSSISSAGSATMTIDSVLPSLKRTGMAATSLGALTSARNHRGASDSLFSSRMIDEASDGSPNPARTCLQVL